jgi:hypothetical protein
MRRTGLYVLLTATLAVAAVIVPLIVASSEPAKAIVPALFTFGGASSTTLPAGLAIAPAAKGKAGSLHIGDARGQRALVNGGNGGGAVLYADAGGPSPSIEETFSFVYSGPGSIVEPFFVDASSTARGAVDGLVTNLAGAQSGSSLPGNIASHRTDAAGVTRETPLGRLRTEPYHYEAGHTYRVDALVDAASGVRTTRIYDVRLGPQTFDTRITVPNDATAFYPGLLCTGGEAAVLDFAYGPPGHLPPMPHPSRRAGDYMNYLGYNAGVRFAPTTPDAIAFVRYFPELLIKHVRVPAEMHFLPAINAVARYGIDADVLTGNRTTMDGLHRFIAGLALPPDSLELWNEPNNPGMGASYDPLYAQDLPAFAKDLAQNFPHVPIWGPSMLAIRGYPSAAIGELAHSLGPLISAWNAHSYTQATPENLGYGPLVANACGESFSDDCGWYGAPNYNDNLSSIMNPKLPGVTTEGAASYGTSPGDCGHTVVDAATQQAYIQRGMLYNFKLGHLRIYPYNFEDSGGCRFGTYGLLSKVGGADGQHDFFPKPSYVSLVYLDHLIADLGEKAKSFEARPLTYALENAQPDIEEMLLAESDGSYRLILWSDAVLWDFDANGIRAVGKELPLRADAVRVVFPAPLFVSVYTQEPGTGVWSAGREIRSNSVGVTVNQFPLVLAISTQEARERGSLLPQAVPSAGPTQTPIPPKP